MQARWYLLVGFTALTTTAYAQSVRPGGDDYAAKNPAYDGRYAFVRLRYSDDDIWGCDNGDIKGPGWHHDYPVGERTLMQLMTDLTSLDARADSSLILRPDDPQLMKYPIAYLAEPGCWLPSDSEVAALRAYLLKGGFLIVDDMIHPSFENTRQNFEEQIQRVLPEGRLMPVERSDPLFTAFFDLEHLRIPPILADAQPEFRGIYEDNDPTKRLLVIANYDNDMSEYWFYRRTGIVTEAGHLAEGDIQEAYKLGVNYILYGFVH